VPVSDTNAVRELYEFGPFRVDVAREMLLRDDNAIPLPPKAFQVLLVLLRNNQELVTKDDLMKEVWPDTFVEETNLSRNIFLLRKALGESPQEHRYILTVPGRGYRLAETVRLVPGQDVSIIASTLTNIRVEVSESTRRRFLPNAVLLAFVSLIAIAAVLWFVRSRPAHLDAKDTVVIADFANSTSDPVFDTTLRQGLSIQLTQSPYLGLISDERIQHTLKLMGQPLNARITPEIARGVCERTGGAAVLEPSIASLGTAYVLGLRARNCRNGDVLDDEQAQAAKKEDVIGILSQLAGKLRNRLGESLAAIDQHNTPLSEATTPSLDALRAYSLGWQATFGPAGAVEAVPFFKRAVELDPNFVSAYAMLGRVYQDMGENALAAENTTKAYQLRDRTSDPEKFFIESNFHLTVTGDLEKARQVAELWARTYPRDSRPYGFLSFIYQDLGRYDKSIEAGKAAVEIDRDLVPGYANLAWAYVLSDRLDDAEQTVRLAQERNLEFPDLYILLYDIAFLRNDEPGMRRSIEMAQGKAGGEHWIAQREADVLAFSGLVKEARLKSQHAVQLAQNAGQPERAALYQSGIATREALFGNVAEARLFATSAIRNSKDRDVEYGAAFALLLIHDEAPAQPIIADLEKRFPEDTFVKFSYLPTLRAISALNHGKPEQALHDLESETPYDLQISGSWAGFFGDMYPVYIRGMALLAIHNGSTAATEFQSIIDHRGIVASDPIGALAILRQAQALAIAGQNQQSEQTWQRFSSLWANADPDTPILKSARSEHASTH
jgi:DNA-binding winged helix-turn-helix (wHTH) protein/tetratricopeptide (TPR) repeat protein